MLDRLSFQGALELKTGLGKDGSRGRAFSSPEEEVEQDAGESNSPLGDEGRNIDLKA